MQQVCKAATLKQFIILKLPNMKLIGRYVLVLLQYMAVQYETDRTVCSGTLTVYGLTRPGKLAFVGTYIFVVKMCKCGSEQNLCVWSD